MPDIFDEHINEITYPEIPFEATLEVTLDRGRGKQMWTAAVSAAGYVEHVRDYKGNMHTTNDELVEAGVTKAVLWLKYDVDLIDEDDHRDLHEDTMGVNPSVLEPPHEDGEWTNIEDYKEWLRNQDDEYWDRQ